jgi:hypothetical protein
MTFPGLFFYFSMISPGLFFYFSVISPGLFFYFSMISSGIGNKVTVLWRLDPDKII